MEQVTSIVYIGRNSRLWNLKIPDDLRKTVMISQELVWEYLSKRPCLGSILSYQKNNKKGRERENSERVFLLLLLLEKE